MSNGNVHAWLDDGWEMILVTQGVEYQMGIGWHWINVCCEIMSISKKTNVWKKKVALYIYICVIIVLRGFSRCKNS